eukprot:1880185-Rhodomonas_salina.1
MAAASLCSRVRACDARRRGWRRRRCEEERMEEEEDVCCVERVEDGVRERGDGERGGVDGDARE